jgi:hypothetical protein
MRPPASQRAASSPRVQKERLPNLQSGWAKSAAKTKIAVTVCSICRARIEGTVYWLSSSTPVCKPCRDEKRRSA